MHKLRGEESGKLCNDKFFFKLTFCDFFFQLSKNKDFSKSLVSLQWNQSGPGDGAEEVKSDLPDSSFPPTIVTEQDLN